MSDKMTDVEKLIERLAERASSYRDGCPSPEHTAALLDEAAAMLRSLNEDRDELILQHQNLFNALEEAKRQHDEYVAYIGRCVEENGSYKP